MYMPNLSSRFSLAMGVAASVLATTWLLLVSLLYMADRRHAHMVTRPVPFQVARVTHQHHALPPKIQEEEKNMNALALHTFQREYTCVFTGKVSCGDGPCKDAEVQIHVASAQNPEIVRKTNLQEDGSYEVTVLLKEFPHEQVDWSISAGSPDASQKQIQGRQILMDDSTIAIEEPLLLL
jgi:hypothetical protein